MSSNYQYVIDLVRREVPEGSLSQTIVWPFYYWSAVVPERITEDTPNIFEQLYMSIKMVSKDIDPKDIFRQLQIEPELYKSIEKSCKEDGFDTESLKIKNDNLASIKIFKDAVVGKLVPELTIKEIPKEYKLDNLKYKPSYNASTMNKPNVYEIEKMLRCFKVNKRRFNEENVLDIIDSNEEMEESWDDDEGDWNLEPLESVEKPVITMTDAEEKLASMVQIDDIYPEIVWVRMNIYVEPTNPNIVRMLSPFKNVPNGFFDNILSLAAREEDFRDSLEILRLDMLDSVKDSVAFNNEYSISVLDSNPILSNYDEYSDIKYRIQELYKAKETIENDKGSAYDNYFNRCGKLLEALFQHVFNILNKDERATIKKYIHASDFSYQLQTLLEDLGQEDYSMVIHYSVKHVYACLDRRTITPKSVIIVLAFYAAKVNKNLESMFKNNNGLVSDIYKIYDIRNKYNHNTNIETNDDTNPYIMLESAYEKIMNIVDVITKNCFKVEK